MSRNYDPVPMAPLAELILRWAEGRDRGNATRYEEENGWVGDLAKFSGVSTRRIRAIVAGHQSDSRFGVVHHVSFRTADALTTAMDMNMEWHNPLTLGPYYGPLSIQKYERDFEQPVPEELEAVA